ncbi:hypothetical protein EJ03DRAFT_197387 [Teratosphaeria nubilosa]|uniref:BTB domain-containing protein n=1 Tax=Teratosphaeria nubilosa TaxID=161662 RepID=A0A6G1L014_9PEZI|nr:hypothetical protein EJ03DRAFT_197387 [Teratosphaeria nubilosa]
MPDLMNATMNEALARSTHVKQTFTAATVNKAYRYLNRDSIMIRFLVRHAAENIDTANMPTSAAPFCSESLGDVIRRLLEHHRGSTLLKASSCTYHNRTDGHRADKSCLRSLSRQWPTPDTDLIHHFNDMTTVLVGHQRQRIRAHTRFLCRSSPIFEDAISGQLAESSSEELCLDTESVSTFSAFLTWMYTGEIDAACIHQEAQEPPDGAPGSITPFENQSLRPVDLINLYIFGDNWEISAVRNDVMSFIINKIEATDEPAWDLLTICHEHIHLAFNNLPKGSALLRFLTAEAAWLWDPSLLEQELDEMPNDFLAGILNTRPRVEQRRREGMIGWTPWRDDICIYHDHGSEDAEKQICHEKNRDLQQRLKAKIRYRTAR